MADLSDDEVIALAKAIQERRQLAGEIATFRGGHDLMIRWATGLGAKGRSYVDVRVAPEDVAALINTKTAPQIAALDEKIANLRKGDRNNG